MRMRAGAFPNQQTHLKFELNLASSGGESANSDVREIYYFINKFVYND